MKNQVIRLVRSLWRTLYRVAAVLGFVLIIVTTTPLLNRWTDALSAQWGSGKGDVMVLLGAGVTTPDVISLNSYWRCVHAVILWRAGKFKKVIIAGRDEASLMRDFLLMHGVPADAIALENRSTSTHENALFVAEMIPPGSGRVVLVTSDYHMGRALAAFRKAGLDPDPFPLPDAHKRFNDPAQRVDVFYTLALETVKAVYYRMKGWV